METEAHIMLWDEFSFLLATEVSVLFL